MSENVLNAFPRDLTEALALLYVQSQDLSGKTAKEMLEMYTNAYKEISEAQGEKFASDWTC